MPGYYSEEEEDTTFGRKNQPLARYWTWIFFWHLNLTIAKKNSKTTCWAIKCPENWSFFEFLIPKKQINLFFFMVSYCNQELHF